MTALRQQLVSFSVESCVTLFADLTTELAWLTARQNYEPNGLETRRSVKKYSLPDAARHVSLLSQLLDFKFGSQSFEQD